MHTAPARQPRVSPAAPRIGRRWLTAASLVGAALIAGVVMVPPFAAGTVFPSRSAELPPPSVATESVMASAIAANADKPPADVETKYSDLPLTTNPANEPPRNPEPEPAASDQTASGTLVTGIFASRLISEPEAMPVAPSAELTVQPIPPLATPAPTTTQPPISPPPARREPLPLQTDLLPTETPGQPGIAKSGPDHRG
jgi:hypothetical protein